MKVRTACKLSTSFPSSLLPYFPLKTLQPKDLLMAMVLAMSAVDSGIAMTIQWTSAQDVASLAGYSTIHRRFASGPTTNACSISFHAQRDLRNVIGRT